MSDKLVDFESVTLSGDKECSPDDLIRAGAKLAADLMREYRPFSCIVILGLAQKLVDQMVEGCMQPEAVDCMNQAADDFVDEVTFRRVESKGES